MKNYLQSSLVVLFVKVKVTFLPLRTLNLDKLKIDYVYTPFSLFPNCICNESYDTQPYNF